MILITKLISGGQTGVDRAVLDFARVNEIDYGGFTPADGWAEDFHEAPGVIGSYPKLQPTAERDPRVRTRLNVEHSNATLIITPPRLQSSGTAYALKCCEDLRKPFLKTTGLMKSDVVRWLDSLEPAFPELVLHIAGPRASEAPRIQDRTYKLLDHIFRAD